MQLINKDDINNLATNFKLGTSHPPESCWRGSSFPNCYAKSEISVKNEKVDYCEYFLGGAENMQYGQKNTDHLLHVCKHSCKQKALGSKVDDTEEQGVKDQQCGLVSIIQHVTKSVRLICHEKCKQTSCTHT